ncbi:Protein XRI1 [Camellia lanceoleosa]|uniref:Protein XRI1 n=1 Tax=Camellia lanceoleosa TaxID=1840588 RepID=A0ACC0INW8_9ERIC|nr:Protein XRI1 [Camellia lanceoleosa]
MWDWHGEGYCLQKETNLDISPCLWDGVSQNEEDLSYMFDETTPVKACGDLAYHVSDNGERRLSEEALSDMSHWVSGFEEDTSATGHEGLDQSSEGWLADCLNNDEMHCSPDDLNLSGPSDVQIDISEFCNTPPEYEACVAQEHPTGTRRNVVFKGRKSYMRTPTKLASSVAYPFAFIKPCGVRGDVTLKDINQRILTPPPSKSKESNEDPSASYPTSAISGKPVVGKTKIRTEGGKGSITIMITKG